MTPRRRSIGVAVGSALVVALLAAPAHAQTDPPQLRDRVLVLAHRGASFEKPEHTFSAYDEAVADDTDFLECDLQLTRDEVLVCVHDTTVDRTSDGEGRVDSFSLAELRQLDFGSWKGPEHAGQRIVPFEEQLQCYRSLNEGLRFHIETKAPTEYGGRMEPELIRLLEKYDLVDPDPATSPVIVQSFEASSLAVVNQLSGDRIPTALLSFVGPPTLPPMVDISAPNAAHVVNDPTYVEAMHAQGKEVHTYTTNDEAPMRTLIERGVDGIFTDRPDVLRSLLVAEFPALSTAPGNPGRGTFALGCPGVAGTITSSAAGPAPVVPEVPQVVVLPVLFLACAAVVALRRRSAA